MFFQMLLLRWRIFNQFFTFWLFKAVMPFISRRFNLHYDIPKEIRKLTRKGCVVIGNHAISWDPFMVNNAFRIGVHWVATEAIFRKTFARIFMYNFGAAIPKTKNRSDMEMLKLLQGYIKLNRPVGIFAEGQQTWDGKGLPPMAGTAKLIRFLKVPVIFVKSEGAFLTKPRWTKLTRRNKITYRYSLGISAEEVKTMKVSEIQTRLEDLLNYDEYMMQKERMIPLKSEKRAEHVELTLFTCSSCKSLGKMRSSGNKLRCSNCGMEVEVDEYGFFKDSGQKPYFESPVDWNSWQQEHLRGIMQQFPEDKPFCSDKIQLFTSRRRRPLVKAGQGTAELYRDRIEYTGDNGEKRIFKNKDYTGFNVFKQQNMEFYSNHLLYRFKLTDPGSSSLQWLSVIHLINQMDKEDKDDD